MYSKGSGPLGSGPTGPGPSYFVMPYALKGLRRQTLRKTMILAIFESNVSQDFYIFVEMKVLF